MTRISSYVRHTPNPSPVLADKIRRFKKTYGAIPDSVAGILFEYLKEPVVVDRPVIKDALLYNTAKEAAEDLEKEIDRWIESKKRIPSELSPEVKKIVEEARASRLRSLPVDIERRLDSLETALDRKRTETGRRREIERIRLMIRDYEIALGRPAEYST